MPKPSPIYISVLTGFLGAGKTTILNEILSDNRFKNTMVIINEYGDIGLDHLMVENTDNDMLLMSSGCICCSIRGDLVTTFEKILRDIDNGRIKAIDQIIIETTGIASPGPIIGSFLSHPYLNLRFTLRNIITVADATNIVDTLKNHDEAQQQLGMADHIIVSKADLIDEKDLPYIKQTINNYAPNIPQYLKSNIDIATLIFDHQTAKVHQENKPSEHHHGHHNHDAINAINFVKDGAYNQQQLWNFLDILRSEYGKDILRIKAIVSFDDAPQKAFAIHAVQHLLFPAKALDIEFSGQSKLVIIGKQLNKGKIQGLYNAFMGNITSDQADITAIEDNPLSLLGATINLNRGK